MTPAGSQTPALSEPVVRVSIRLDEARTIQPGVVSVVSLNFAIPPGRYRLEFTEHSFRMVETRYREQCVVFELERSAIKEIEIWESTPSDS